MVWTLPRNAGAFKNLHSTCIIREQLRRILNIHLRDGCQLQGLIATPDNRRVTGTKMNSGGALVADLVVDAMGRGSHSPIWLEAISSFGES
jgi:hypothetical protein